MRSIPVLVHGVMELLDFERLEEDIEKADQVESYRVTHITYTNSKLTTIVS